MAPSKPTYLAAALFAAGLAHAQTSGALPPVTVTEKPFPPAADVTGFGDIPLREVPASANVVTSRDIDAAGARRLADLARFDASVSDAYNAPGYWDFLTIRGFILDNRFNFRREGLPISAETTIPLDNKERVEILRGTSGIQAGTSAPGGLVNYVVKRPPLSELREVKLEFTQRASMLAAVDLGGRFGSDGAIGWRINAAHESLRPQIHNLDGDRSLLAFAADWRFTSDDLLEGEFEWSTHRQPSAVGFSLLGPVLPPEPDPRLNLNNQPWSQPSRFDAATGTLRYSHAFSRDWYASMRLGTQQLKSNDYTAFPFGCGAEGNYDRFCSDGTFDLYDYRSEDERRRRDAALLDLHGRLDTGSIRHDVSLGWLMSRASDRFQPQAYNYVGTGNIAGTAVLPPDPTQATIVPDKHERSVELSVNDAMHVTPRFTAWLGLRHTRIHRAYTQSLTTPWAALSYKLGDALAYASWGEGVESWQVTTDPVYALANAGQVLPSAKSRQVELGVKGSNAELAWDVAVFQIIRPMTNFDYCLRTFACTVGEYDGRAVHRGIEASGQWTHGPWKISASATLLDAKRRDSVYEPAANGQHPPNVPDHTLRATATYRVPALPLELEGHVSHEGERNVLSDGSLSIPSWTRMDAALRYKRRIGAVDTTWTVGVTNVFDSRYWRESPFEFGHVYLYPGQPRTFRIGLTAAL
ncbi:MAG TPA: TonB-dependent siderophore receptor [Ramlibacter sp.]|uniref:TonB-dependent siderophore receptor n=1 Tax=Ramlibacter sp. TaxID=1917967 RepID=UPI002CB67E20|nr:TonB-dependent siderophore receptor [Ramlibacter sp.]HVZ43725.1 TonB-dependent siderophore receptor [Ramlibacter sp.]